MRVLLLYPPITDPTSPYHSLVYVASHARASGFDDVEIRDTNIEALIHHSEPRTFAACKESWRRRLDALQRKSSLTVEEQVEYMCLAKADSLSHGDLSAAMALLRDEERFYAYPAYRLAVHRVRHWLDGLSCAGYPGQFGAGFSLAACGRFNLSSFRDLMDPGVLDRVAAPFALYYEERLFPEVSAAGYAVVGVNVTYTSQLPFALWMVRRLREVLPEAYIVCGGTEVTGVWKYARDRTAMSRLFHGADACVIGEGETAFVKILENLSLGRRPEKVANTLTFDGKRRALTDVPSLLYEDLDALPTPNYGLMREQPYLSPHRMVFYSPTRGCYWNKCTFCDYGLNFGTPTSPWRQRSLDKVLDDLREAARYSRFVYLSVDVLAPSAVVALARAIVNARIDIRWAAEMRLERFFDARRTDILRQSGCVAVSVGFESGVQRILDAIDKGTKLSDVTAVIRNFTEAGIAVQMMGFTGFPTESTEEALESVAFLRRVERDWTVAGLGEFDLTPGSLIAQRPEAFGLREVAASAGDDIVRALRFVERGPPDQAGAKDIASAKRQLRRADLDRPFAGGIDATHSIFYYDRYGCRFPRAFPVYSRAGPPEAWTAPVELNGFLLEDQAYDLATFTRWHELAGQPGNPVGPAAGAAGETPSGREVPRADLRGMHFVRHDGMVLPASEELRRLVERVNGERSLDEVLSVAAADDPGQSDVYRLLAQLMARLQLVVPR